MTDAPPLDRPLYGATPVQALSRFWRNYAVFSGRASRSEYWWMALWGFVIACVLTVPAVTLGIATASDPSDGPGPGGVPFLIAILLFGLAAFVPAISISWRRMHDIDLPGPLWFIRLFPYIGDLVWIVLAALPSKPRGARYDLPGLAPTVS